MIITTKKINGYYRAKKEWISANDNYNKIHFGITKDEYTTLWKVESSLFGIMAGNEKMTVKQVKERIQYL